MLQKRKEMFLVLQVEHKTLRKLAEQPDIKRNIVARFKSYNQKQMDRFSHKQQEKGKNLFTLCFILILFYCFQIDIEDVRLWMLNTIVADSATSDMDEDETQLDEDETQFSLNEPC